MKTQIIKVNGILIEGRRSKKVFNGRENEFLWVSLAEVELSDENKKILKDAFKESGAKFTPEWVKNFDGYVNTKSIYDINAVDVKGKKTTLETMLTEHNDLIGSKVVLALSVKNGAVYPFALKFLEYGEEKDFADVFEEDAEVPFE